MATSVLPVPNPFDSTLARANSNYNAPDDGELIRLESPAGEASSLTRLVHDSVRALVLNPAFSCLGAKAAFRKRQYRFGLYPELVSPEATAGLARDLFFFAGEQPVIGSDYTTFVASFHGPVPVDEMHFEELLWAQLQCLHQHDREHHGWDPHVSPDPNDSRFSFSFAGRAFFVVGLHPASSRWSRRFAWPTLVFNAHEQFERLRQRGQFARMRDLIRERELALQGSINPALSNYGERSEARQYAGRDVEPEWTCPFHSHPPNGEGNGDGS